MKQITLQKIIFLILVFSAQLSFSRNVSDIMPVILVDYMRETHQWLPQYNDDSSVEHQDIYAFFEEFKKENPDVSFLVENIFNPIEQKSGFDQLPANYTQKIQILRYFRSASDKKNSVETIMQALNRKYVEISAALIAMAEIPEYEVTLKNLSQQIAQNEIRIVDLNPELRRSILADKKTEPMHGYLNKAGVFSEKYVVNGVFSQKSKTIAIDLMRPIAESVVTLAHEIVHSSDPYIFAKKAQAQQLIGYVKAKLSEKLNVPITYADLIVQALLADVFYESGRFDVLDLVKEIAALRRDKIVNTEVAAAQRESAERAAIKELMNDIQIQTWMAALISSTVENEYRSYVLSLAVYCKLKQKYNILPSSNYREGFIEHLTQHEFSFLKSLETSVNPFMLGTQLSILFNSHPQITNLQNNDDLKRRIIQLKNVIEQHYLIESENLFATVAQTYHRALAIITSSTAQTAGQFKKEDVIPEWTQRGKSKSVTSPYTILTAKVSTASLLQFKADLKDIISGLRESQEALLLMKANILPLHNLNLGELKLIGIQRPNANQSIVPPTVQDRVRSQIIDQREQLVSLFADQAWDPQSIADYKSIPQSDLMKSIYQLHIAKSVYWLRNRFPLLKINLVTLKLFGHKLNVNEKFYDQSELSEDRANFLKDEIQKILNDSYLSAEDFALVKELIQDLGFLYQISVDQKWNSLALELYDYVQGAKSSLMSIGVSNEISLKSILNLNSTMIDSFKSQIKKEYPECQTDQNLSNATSSKKFNLGDRIFRVTTICYNKKYYILRQPGDHTGTIKVDVQNDKPQISIFYEARPVSLEPAF